MEATTPRAPVQAPLDRRRQKPRLGPTAPGALALYEGSTMLGTITEYDGRFFAFRAWACTGFKITRRTV
jgi:hypothetical protein